MTELRVPPNDLRAEESALGAMLLSREPIGVAWEAKLSPDDFYKPAHALVFAAMMALAEAGEPVDVVTVATQLGVETVAEVGGPGVLLDLQASTPAISNAPKYIAAIQEAAGLRRLLAATAEIQEAVFNGESLAQATADAERAVLDMNDVETGSLASSGQLMTPVLDHLELVADLASKGELDAILGAPTGLADVDELIGGLEPGKFYVVGARPAMGKSSFLLGAAINASKTDGRPVLFFTLEMSQREMATRLLCMEALVDSGRARKGQVGEVEWNRIANQVGHISEAPLFIDDDPYSTVSSIRAKATRLKARTGDLGVVVVDYLQLMTVRGWKGNRQEEVSEISRGLKLLARELDCAVVAAAQLNRGLESRLDKRPMLSDLRESGSVEQNADVVMFLYRDEVYDDESPDRGVAEIIVAKQRNGPIGKARCAFRGQYTRFDNMAKHIMADGGVFEGPPRSAF